MKFWERKKRKIVGKGTDKTVSLNKEFDVFNYTPVDYAYTSHYAEFLLNAEKYFRTMLNKVSVDEYNAEMFDCYIDTFTNEMKEAALNQYTYHAHVIRHHKGLVEGVLAKATAHRENLLEDVEEINKDIIKCENLKKC